MAKNAKPERPAAVPFKVTIAQIPQQRGLETIERIIRERRDSQLIIFPENTFTVTDLSVVRKLRSLCRIYDTSVIIGIIHQDKHAHYDYAFYIAPRQVLRYQKVHVHWTETHVPGNEFRVVQTPECAIGMQMCYDAAFPEASRVLALMGAQLIVIISAIPTEFPSRFATLRARGIAYSNQIFLAHCCRPGKRFSGHSTIIDPYGDIVMELGKYTEIRSKTINLDVVRAWREKERTYEYRRPDMYSLVSALRNPEAQPKPDPEDNPTENNEP